MILALIGACLSGVLYAASFPPVSAAPLAWLSLVPLLVAAVRVPPGKAAICGVIWAVVATYGVGRALPGMVTDYFELPFWVGWTVFILVSVGLAGVYFGSFTAWVSWMSRRGGIGPIVVAAAWGACELARARLWIGNPWALSGYSQVGFHPLMQIADTTGPYGVGILIAAVNACLAAVFVPALRGRRFVLSLVAIGCMLIGSLAYGSWRLQQDFRLGQPIRVAAVQGAIERGFRWRPEYQQLGIHEYVALTQEAATTRPHLVFWPEYAVSFYLQEETPERVALLDGIRSLGGDLILGGPHYEFARTGTIYHNSVFLVRGTRVISRYDKIHLLPVAEREVFGGLIGSRSTPLSPGKRRVLLETGVAKVAAVVCFEAMYPELVRRFVSQGAEVLANLSNDDWFGNVWAARQHLMIASVRAIENRRYLVRATQNGFSAVVDPHGRIINESGFGDPEVLTSVIYASDRRTPYQQWGDLVVWLAVCLVVGASARRTVMPFSRT